MERNKNTSKPIHKIVMDLMESNEVHCFRRQAKHKNIARHLGLFLA